MFQLLCLAHTILSEINEINPVYHITSWKWFINVFPQFSYSFPFNEINHVIHEVEKKKHFVSKKNDYCSLHLIQHLTLTGLLSCFSTISRVFEDFKLKNVFTSHHKHCESTSHMHIMKSWTGWVFWYLDETISFFLFRDNILNSLGWFSSGR